MNEEPQNVKIEKPRIFMVFKREISSLYELRPQVEYTPMGYLKDEQLIKKLIAENTASFDNPNPPYKIIEFRELFENPMSGELW